MASAELQARVQARKKEREKERGDYAVHSLTGVQGSTFTPTADPKEKESQDAQGTIRYTLHTAEELHPFQRDKSLPWLPVVGLRSILGWYSTTQRSQPHPGIAGWPRKSSGTRTETPSPVPRMSMGSGSG